jgi:hypothetical protein
MSATVTEPQSCYAATRAACRGGAAGGRRPAIEAAAAAPGAAAAARGTRAADPGRRTPARHPLCPARPAAPARGRDNVESARVITRVDSTFFYRRAAASGSCRIYRHPGAAVPEATSRQDGLTGINTESCNMAPDTYDYGLRSARQGRSPRVRLEGSPARCLSDLTMPDFA